MTIDDRIRTSLVAHAELPPDLPGLYGAVSARARMVRRRRRVTTSVASCVAVVAIAVPFALKGFGGSDPGPSSPTPPPSASFQPTPVVTVQPSPTQSLAPAPATTTARRVDRPTRPPAPPVPALLFPAGPVPDVPLLIRNGSRLTMQKKDQTITVGPYASAYPTALQTSYGVVLVTRSGYVLVTPEHRVVALAGTKGFGGGCRVGVLSPDGRYLAWGRQDLSHYKPNSGTPAGEYGLYDLKQHRILDRVASPREGCPEAFLNDGRVAAGTGDGGDSGSAIWDPVTGKVTEVQKANVTVVLPSGHKLAMTFGGEGGCMRRVAASRSSDCLELAGLSPGGQRALKIVGLGGVDLVDMSNGDTDTRLTRLLTAKHFAPMEAAWVDDTHLAVLGSTRVAVSAGDGWGYQRLLSCEVPAAGGVSCREAPPLGPSFTVAVGVDAGVTYGPLAALAGAL